MIVDEQRVLSLRLWGRALARRVHRDSLLRNSMYNMATTVATSVLGFVYWIVAARTYSAHDVGLASALIAALTLTSSLSSQGIGPTLVQMLPRRAAGSAWSLTLNAGLATGSLASVLAGSIVVAALPLFSHQFAIVGHHAGYAVAFVVGVVLWTISTLVDQAFVAERATGYMLVRNMAFAVLKIPLLVLPLLLAHVGAIGIFSSWVVATAATVLGGGLLLVPGLRRDYSLAMRGMVGQVRSMLSSLAGHHFINLGGIGPMYLLPMLVTARLSATDNAYFYTTWMLGSLFFMVSPAVAMSLFAEGSYGVDGLLRKVRSSALIIGALLGPAMLTFFLGGRYILWPFGPNYVQHGLLLLTILIVSAVPDAITNIYVSVLRVRRRLRRAAMFNLSMAALTLVLAWVLLPMVGIAGAGWAWLIAQTVGSTVVGMHVLATHRASGYGVLHPVCVLRGRAGRG